jgi:hypothetical protein
MMIGSQLFGLRVPASGFVLVRGAVARGRPVVAPAVSACLSRPGHGSGRSRPPRAAGCLSRAGAGASVVARAPRTPALEGRHPHDEDHAPRPRQRQPRPRRGGRPAGKLADAELLFHDGPLTGLKLTGLAVWSRKDGSQHVTVPTRPYVANGEKKSFALLRPVSDVAALDGVRTLIVEAYTAQVAAAEPAE